MKNFDKAKNRPRRKWYTISIKTYEVYLWGLPFIPFVLLSDYIKDRRYKRLEWSEEKATKMLHRILPKILEWVEEDKAFYFCMDWRYSGYQHYVPLWNRAWVRKFASKMHEYVKTGYQHPNYVKTVESDGYETWIKFEEKRG